MESNNQIPKTTKPPLFFSTKSYSGKKENLKREYHQRLKNTNAVVSYLNSLRQDQPQVKSVYEIAEATGLSKEVVHAVLSENGHGANGITF